MEDKVTVERKRCEGGLRETRTFKAVDVVTRDGADRETARRCLIVWYSVSDDVALLLPDDAGGLDGVELSRAKVRAGDSLWFCGGGVVDWNLSKSWAVRPGRNASGHFLVAAGTGWYGHSGSGVFADGNCGGPRLVGMICTAYGTGNARILGAVPAETILASIARYKAEVEDNSNEAGPPARRQ